MFDTERTGTGTAEWAEVTENICRGCANNCLYCYAAHNANRFKLRERKEWGREELTKRADIISYPAKDGVVMFPSSHDITPFNVDAYIRVAKLILEKGNRLLIVSKPHLDVIKKVCAAMIHHEKQILFRFTIGTLKPEISLFWEPGAPLPNERIMALEFSKSAGFNTSVSIEPMLHSWSGAVDVVDMVEPFVTDTIWIGKMNKPQLRVDNGYRAAVEQVLLLQRDEAILKLVEMLGDNPKIRWKDSIKAVIATRC
jgi:DNA repair photolyase